MVAQRACRCQRGSRDTRPAKHCMQHDIAARFQMGRLGPLRLVVADAVRHGTKIIAAGTIVPPARRHAVRRSTCAGWDVERSGGAFEIGDRMSRSKSTGGIS